MYIILTKCHEGTPEYLSCLLEQICVSLTNPAWLANRWLRVHERETIEMQQEYLIMQQFIQVQ